MPIINLEPPITLAGSLGAYELDSSVFEAHSTPTKETSPSGIVTPEAPSELADLGIDLDIKPAAQKKVSPHQVYLQSALIDGGVQSAIMLKFCRADGSNKSVYCEKIVSDWIRNGDSIASKINLGEDTTHLLYHKNNIPVLNHRYVG